MYRVQGRLKKIQSITLVLSTMVWVLNFGPNPSGEEDISDYLLHKKVIRNLVQMIRKALIN